MKKFSGVVLAAAIAVVLALGGTEAGAQVSFGVNIGPAPVCPYGYFDYAPYNCAPYGYYGPTWFNNGVFIGAGPWFRGPARFHGPVDRRFDPRGGYRGMLPPRGSRPDRAHPVGRNRNFRGNEQRDGRGHTFRGR